MRKQATDWEKIPAKDTSDKGLLLKKYKEFLKCNNKKMNLAIKKTGRRPIQTAYQRYIDTYGK